jgi:monofunctional biosynthetic peptidoglycan transglycosylase
VPSKVTAARRKQRRTLWQWPLGALSIAMGCLAYSYLTLPDVRPLATVNPRTTAFIALRDEQARAEGRSAVRQQRWVAYTRISPDLKRAVLVTEDAAFWQHEGIDFYELQKSIEVDWAKGRAFRGASTITQQLAKNLYLSPSKNPVRKVREWIIARRLEAELKKARILELYLNVIEWGDGIYGIEAASRTYFGVSASALDANRSALLAAVIRNPRAMNPLKPTAQLSKLQQIILRRMGSVQPPEATTPVRGTVLPRGPDITSDPPSPIESPAPDSSLQPAADSPQAESP